MPRPRHHLSLVALVSFFLAIACIVIAHERQQTRRAAEEELEVVPPVMPLPKRRKRALTPPPSRRALDAERSQRTRSQWRSPLFAKLPIEIRTMIYEQALARETLHVVGRVDQVRVRRGERGERIVQDYLRLEHVKCLSKCHPVCRERKSYNDKCWDCYALDGDRRSRKRSDSASKVAFLQSCRRIYVEAIDVLYRCNTFDFHCMDNLVPFATTILPRRLNSIRSLRLHQHFGFYLTDLNRATPFKHGTKAHTDWCMLWSLVAGMDGVRELEVYPIVYFDQWPQRMDLEQETNLLEPLMMVTHVRRFVVHVSWLRPQPAFDREDMPFQIVDDASLGK